MNFAQETYKNLMQLIAKDEAFSFKDFTLQDKVYRIMDYRLASWTSFQEPSAINCRGIMYDITDLENVKLASLPPAKFFNYEEGNVEHTKGKLGDKMVKMDGSLISSYIHNGEVYLKSKGSLFSSQAQSAMRLLDLPENEQFKSELNTLAAQGFTVNLEYTSPDNRIVVPYQTEELTLLSARRHEDGKNFFASNLLKLLSEQNLEALKDKLVHHVSLHDQEIEQLKFVDDVRDEQEGEGYVVEIVLPDGSSYLVKIKNLKYIALHHTKDSVDIPRRLFEAVLEGGTDDLRAMFATDPYVLQKIQDMEDHVQPIFNNLVKTVEDFLEENKGLVRKEFAVKVMKEHPKLIGLMMNGYLDQEIDYKSYAKKYRKEMFGIGDEDVAQNEESIVRPKLAA